MEEYTKQDKKENKKEKKYPAKKSKTDPQRKTTYPDPIRVFWREETPSAEIRPTTQEEEDDDKLQQITNYLTYVLLRPWPVTGLPLLYVEDDPAGVRFQEPEAGMSEIDGSLGTDNEVMRQMPYKRSRYYRKYPWKRQNSRET
ncbi:hypothetical protein MML48_3g00019106 [Holotrichia oblita]|uniref:Uncharacterized protein n=1 Tax=Holotrichia oblita TaxID=644536 RepID=A0ACB9TH97_HOLOL|nr:hypothetical protein MML48_3g00019106 [Holotrichia oblita]